jgi:hypothetical protein
VGNFPMVVRKRILLIESALERSRTTRTKREDQFFF